jgi:hypothetical protein
MVAEYGEMACTICFPDAPTFKGFGDGTSTYARRTQAEKDAKAAEKAAKEASKAAKRLDSPVYVNRYPNTSKFRDLIETIAAAKSWIKTTIDDQAWGYNLDAEWIASQQALLVAALEAKGVDVAPMIAKWTKAAAKSAGK